MWGDGSGTGTGGTFKIDADPLRMWKGRWSPAVFKFSSNWKGLSTLKQSLLRLRAEDPEGVRGITVFYFTDNSTTYWIAASGSSGSPGLPQLIEEIRLLELELECCLQVIHVPGMIMIDQGTDGLSRGIWMSALQGLQDSDRLTQAIFEPLCFDKALVDSYLGNYNLSRSYVHVEWKSVWNARACFDTMSVWFPPPEIARQVIIFILGRTTLDFVQSFLHPSHGARLLVGTVAPHCRAANYLPSPHSSLVSAFAPYSHCCFVPASSHTCSFY
jgi:hypothetical protein